MVSLRLKRLLQEERAQDLIEYTLLIAFVALVSVGLMSQAGSGLQGIWSGAGSTIAVANGNPAAATVTTPPTGGGGGGGNHGDHDGH